MSVSFKEQQAAYDFNVTGIESMKQAVKAGVVAWLASSETISLKSTVEQRTLSRKL